MKANPYWSIHHPLVSGERSTAIRPYDIPLGISSMNPRIRLSKAEYANMRFTPRITSILIGMLLGDGWMQITKGRQPRMAMKQSIINFAHLWETFIELAVICSSYPYCSWNTLRGKRFLSITLQTRRFPCLNEIKILFYLAGSRVKFISPNLFFYMNSIVLAYWIMGDGAKHGKGLVLCTDGFTFIDVVTLLMLKFDINPTIAMTTLGNPIIYISRKDLDKIRPLIMPYMSAHFMYKINPPPLITHVERAGVPKIISTGQGLEIFGGMRGGHDVKRLT